LGGSKSALWAKRRGGENPGCGSAIGMGRKVGRAAYEKVARSGSPHTPIGVILAVGAELQGRGRIGWSYYQTKKRTKQQSCRKVTRRRTWSMVGKSVCFVESKEKIVAQPIWEGD